MPYSSVRPWGVIPHPLPEVNFIMVEIPTPKPYIFMIRVNRQIKCPNNLFFVNPSYIHLFFSFLLIYKTRPWFWLATRLLHLWCFLDFILISFYFVEFIVFFIFSGMMHNWSGFISDVVCCRFKLGKYQQKDSTASSSSPIQSQSLTDNSNFDNSQKVNLLQSDT